jgi:hypothetical protein
VPGSCIKKKAICNRSRAIKDPNVVVVAVIYQAGRHSLKKPLVINKWLF